MHTCCCSHMVLMPCRAISIEKVKRTSTFYQLSVYICIDSVIRSIHLIDRAFVEFDQYGYCTVTSPSVVAVASIMQHTRSSDELDTPRNAFVSHRSLLAAFLHV